MSKMRMLALTVLVTMTIAAAAEAQQRLVLKDGRTIDGVVVETKDGYQVTQPNGLSAEFPKDRVLRVEEVATTADDFKTRFAKAGENPEKLYEVALWARKNKLPLQALATLRKVLRIKPDHENAKLLKKLLEGETIITPPTGDEFRKRMIAAGNNPDRIYAVALWAYRNKAIANAKIALRKALTLNPRHKPSLALLSTIEGTNAKFLTMPDVYRIRLLELSPGENVSVEYRNDVLKRFMNARLGPQFTKAGGERQFLRWPRVKQVAYILNETDRRSGDYRDDIHVKADPLVMKYFKSQVWPVIVKGCASQHCHGSTEAPGKFRLFAMPLTDDRVVYTNYYILHAWQSRGRKTINLDAPENSLLLEMGLPPDVAKRELVHPGKKLANPPFPSRQHPDYRKVKAWIEKLHNPMLPPGYRVSYRLPGLGAGGKPPDPKAVPDPPKPDVIPGPTP